MYYNKLVVFSKLPKIVQEFIGISSLTSTYLPPLEPGIDTVAVPDWPVTVAPLDVVPPEMAAVLTGSIHRQPPSYDNFNMLQVKTRGSGSN